MSFIEIPQFSECAALLATMHGKEEVIAPLLMDSLQIQVSVPDGLNTDSFGTFTRETARPGDQLQTARAKAYAVLDQYGGAIAIASEGSFAPHPLLPMLSCNREMVLFVDRRYDLEVVGEAFSTHTNFNHRTIENDEQALEFAAKVGFPEHGLIAMHPEGQPSSPIIKGIKTVDHLKKAVRQIQDTSSQRVIHLETDMRAMYNPTRMQVIAEATQDLVQKLKSRCPCCQWPNFTVVEYRPSLPCHQCGAPTELTRSVIYRCQRCSFNQETLFPDGRESSDPGQCQFCNP
jgi:hypothetical protein